MVCVQAHWSSSRPTRPTSALTLANSLALRRVLQSKQGLAHSGVHTSSCSTISTLPAPTFSIPKRACFTCSRRSSSARLRAFGGKDVWVQPQSKEAFLAALEGGVQTFVFDDSLLDARIQYGQLARFSALLLNSETGKIISEDDLDKVGVVKAVKDAQSAKALEALVSKQGGTFGPGQTLVLDATDWKVIPAENLVALWQASGATAAGARLMATATTAPEARLMLEALEGGTQGVLLRTADAQEVRALLTYLLQRHPQQSKHVTVPSTPSGQSQPQQPQQQQGLPLEEAVVVRVKALGSGDRACVDTASLLQPGEGLLVGSFARCLALVHSECEASDYIASRPFRVNAGPVHAYVQVPGGRTQYLSELASGSEVLVVDGASGRQRSVLVGRVKVEVRPLVLVEYTTMDGETHSIMLQNAETVKLVGPSEHPQAAGNDTHNTSAAASSSTTAGGDEGSSEPSPPWRTLSVATLAPGDRIYVLRQSAARHTGIAIEERIVEK